MSDPFDDDLNNVYYMGQDAEAQPFKTIPVTKFASIEQAEWIVDEVLPQAELAVIYGEPGCGKTFLTLDMAFSIARGIDWEHHRVTQGRVVYVCAEGAGGFKKRTLAYLTHHKIDFTQPLAFDVIADAPDFLKAVDAQLVATSILNGGKASVIVIDTFSRVMVGGNENSAEHVGHAIAQCKHLHKLTGAIIILIHHSGKDSARGARGWSGLKGAADTEIEVMKIGKGRKAKISKQKDGDDALEWGFQLDVVELGEDDYGKQITSCVYVPTNAVSIMQNRDKPLGNIEQMVLDTFSSFKSYSVDQEEIIEIVKKSIAYDKNKEDRRRDRVIQALNSLRKRKLVDIVDGHICKP